MKFYVLVTTNFLCDPFIVTLIHFYFGLHLLFGLWLENYEPCFEDFLDLEVATVCNFDDASLMIWKWCHLSCLVWNNEMMLKGLHCEEHAILLFAFWKAFLLVWVPNVDKQGRIEVLLSFFHSTYQCNNGTTKMLCIFLHGRV